MLRNSLCPLLLILGAAVLLPQHADAQIYTGTPLYSFCSEANCADGELPNASLIQAADGNFYGSTSAGGAGNAGTLFKLSPAGSLTVLNTPGNGAYLSGAGGTGPNLTQGGDGYFYVSVNGTSEGIVKLSSSGSETVLANQVYSSVLIEGSDGNFYGASYYDSPVETACGGASCGTIIKITPAGDVSVIYTFCSLANCADGWGLAVGLVEGSDGNLYGATEYGGSDNTGTIFKLSKSGTLTTLYNICSVSDCPEGGYNASALVEGSDGNFYGTMAKGLGTATWGTIFAISPTGDFTTLYYPCTSGDCTGHANVSGLFAGSDGNLYGVGATGFYQVTPAGQVAYLFNPPCGGFSCGTYFQTPLVQGDDGNFYGVSFEGGTGEECTDNAYGCGVVYKVAFSPALAAPVQLTLSAITSGAGQPIAITWKALNTFSNTMQQCYLFQSLNGTISPLGKLSGTLTNQVFGGTVNITPSVAGVYGYAVTCGGQESSSLSYIGIGEAKAPTATGLTTTSPVALGSTVTLTAAPTTAEFIGTITGSITFTSGSVTLGTVALGSNGSASLSVTAAGVPTGTYPITATYSGNTNYQASSSTVNVVIQGYATAATLAASSNKLTQGQSVTLTSAVSRTSVSGTPTGTVIFYAGSVEVGSAKLVSGTATLTAATSGSSPAGTYSVTAKYSGDASDQAATSPTVSITLLAATATTLTASPNPVPADSSVTITITVKEKYGTAFPTGTVTLSVGSNTLGSATLADGAATVNASDFGYPAGTYAVTGTYSGDANNAASSGTLNITVE